MAGLAGHNIMVVKKWAASFQGLYEPGNNAGKLDSLAAVFCMLFSLVSRYVFTLFIRNSTLVVRLFCFGSDAPECWNINFSLDDMKNYSKFFE